MELPPYNADVRAGAARKKPAAALSSLSTPHAAKSLSASAATAASAITTPVHSGEQKTLPMKEKADRQVSFWLTNTEHLLLRKCAEELTAEVRGKLSDFQKRAVSEISGNAIAKTALLEFLTAKRKGKR